MSWEIRQGDALERLREMEPESVQTVCTSPPFWGLRDYGAEGQLGLEPTPEQYVANLVEVFREVRRVLRKDGTVWLNLGDSYNTAQAGNTQPTGMSQKGGRWDGGAVKHGRGLVGSLKPKDLVGIPWRVAFALQADGWVLRSEIIWSKSNPMPESVTDRPTRAHEQVFLFSKAKWTGAEEPLPMREADAAWLAALVDGEGSICFQDRTSEGAGTPTFSVRLSIVNTNHALLDRVVEICGLAGVGAPSPRKRNNGVSGRPVYAWQVTNAKAARVIAAIRPHLIAKQRQADLALYVQTLNRKHTGRGGYSVSKADQEAKARVAAACSSLNRGEDVDLGWFTPARGGRWVPQPYVYDADAIREAHVYADDGRELDRDFIERGDDERGRKARMGLNGAGRNRRSVWEIATAPYAEAHFATFPPKLVEPCILAGSPPKCCGECGAPWERVTEREPSQTGVGGGTGYAQTVAENDFPGSNARRGMRGGGFAQGALKDEVWRSTCAHDDDSGHSLVLDPFCGSGTTGVVALRHDRSFLGIELNPSYCELARNRIRDDAPLLNHGLEIAA